MHERPPGRAVALEPDRTRRVRPGDKIVEDDVEPEARRDTVDGGVPHEDRREAVACELAYGGLGLDLGLGIRRDRSKLRGLVELLVSPRCAVHRTGGRE